MVGDGEMQAGLQVTAGQLRVELGRSGTANVLDGAVLQALQDARDGGGGFLQMLEKPAFDARRISRPDVDHSVILKLMYLRDSGRLT